jgi:hypothetical protein
MTTIPIVGPPPPDEKTEQPPVLIKVAPGSVMKGDALRVELPK